MKQYARFEIAKGELVVKVQKPTKQRGKEEVEPWIEQTKNKGDEIVRSNLYMMATKQRIIHRMGSDNWDGEVNSNIFEVNESINTDAKYGRPEKKK